MELTNLKNNCSSAKNLKNKLLDEGRTYAWVASKLQISVAHVWNVLNEKDTLTEKLRTKINELLNTDF